MFPRGTVPPRKSLASGTRNDRRRWCFLEGHVGQRLSHVEVDPGHKVRFLKGSFGKVVHRMLALPAGVFGAGRWAPVKVHLPAAQQYA